MTTANFKDHFSGNAGNYKKYRPVYPDGIFVYLASIAPSSEVAWDCATGSGQAAEKLAQHFSTVIATDASNEQIQNAKLSKNIFYKVAHAEDAPITSNTIDLITVAQALHWFDPKLFFSEARRVLKSNGIIAVWSYNLLSLTPELDEIIEKFYKKIIGAYWPAERRLVEDGYKNITFPFTKITCPVFSMSAEWSLEELLGYISTWSAVKLYREDKGSSPIDIIINELSKNWGEPSRRHKISWPLSVIIGENSR